MKANEFVKKFGWDLVIEHLAIAPESATVISGLSCQFFKQYKDSPVFARVFLRNGNECSVTRFSPIIYPIEIKDLKRLVESYELVQKFGGLNTAKKELKKAYDSCSRIICIRKIGFECSYDELSQAIQNIDGVESLKEMT